MGNQGSTTISFGVAPGTDVARVTIIGQAGILATSLCEAWIDATQPTGAPPGSDHSADEHSIMASMCGVTCQNIVAGAGFDIVVTYRGEGSGRGGRPTGLVNGQFTVSWVWN